MKCPICKTQELRDDRFETGMLAKSCPGCGGNWVQLLQYWRWRESHGPNLPEKPPEEGLRLEVVESPRAKLCPDCGHILTRFKIGHGIAFSIDRCGNCGGVWFDRNEWKILQSRNLHDEIHMIFTESWQGQVQDEDRARAYEQFLLAKFGEKDLAELRRVRAWIDGHPRAQEIRAYIVDKAEK
jgi:Zn-finger nucleic acid-binding protein